MIRWKVVRGNRRSCFSPPKYSKTYTKGKTVEACPNTLGIMVFDSRCNAESFHMMYDNTMVLDVEVTGPGKRPKLIPNGSCDDYKRKVFNVFYTYLKLGKDLSNYEDHFGRLLSPPKGTICYQKVKVLT